VTLVGVGTGIAAAVLVLEPLDLQMGGGLEVVLHALAALELVRIDEHGVRLVDPLLVLVHVGEQSEVALAEPHRFVGLRDLDAGDPFVDELRDRRVRADDDEHRWGGGFVAVALLPFPEALLVAAVQALERTDEGVGRDPVGGVVGLLQLLRERLSDVVPQRAVDDISVDGVVVDRQARDLHDAGFDGVHEREVAHHPGEDEALVVARTLEIEGRGGQVVDRLDPHLLLLADRLEALEPHAGIRVALGRFLLVLGVEDDLVGDRTVLIAVVRFVVDDDDLALAPAALGPAAEIAQHAGDHLIVGLLELVGLVGVAGEELLGVGGDALELLGVPELEGVVVRDGDLGLLEGAPEIVRDEVALAVVVLVVAGVEHAQAIADGDARGDDEEPLGEAGVLRGEDLVDGLPGDEHRHHHGLARARRHLQAEAREAVVVLGVLVVQACAEVRVAVAAGHLGEEDRRLGGLTLAVEDAVFAVWVGPVLEQLAGVRGDALVLADPPQIDLVADVIDERVDLASLTGQIEVERLLSDLLALLLRGDRDERFAGPAALVDDAGRSARPDLEVRARCLVGRVEDRVPQ
jgi:hypothetical protein